MKYTNQKNTNILNIFICSVKDIISSILAIINMYIKSKLQERKTSYLIKILHINNIKGNYNNRKTGQSCAKIL